MGVPLQSARSVQTWTPLPVAARLGAALRIPARTSTVITRFGFEGSNFGFQTSSFGVSAIGFQVSGFELRVSGFGCGVLALELKNQSSGFWSSEFKV